MVDKDFIELVEHGKMRQGNNYGVGVILLDTQTGKIALAKRTDNHLWATPGGKVEVGETPKQGIIRETKEESNVVIRSMICYDYSAHTSPNGKNWLDFLFLSTDFDASKMKNQESEMEPFQWFTIPEALRLDLFPPSRKGLENAIELGILDLNKEIPINEVYANPDGNGYFPNFSECEVCPSFNPYYSDNEGCSYSYIPNSPDWM